MVVGTSAGATAAAQVRSGMPATALLASVLSPPVRPVGHNRERPPSLPMATVFERMRAIGAAATSPADLQRAMGAFGLESDSILEPGAEQRRAMVAARLPRPEWPDRPMIVVAVDAHTGELAAFDRDSGVELVDAVTASTALPGLAPTVSIHGARYIDGGVRSSENADLASGYANVVVLSPLGGRSGTLPEGQFEGLRRPPGADLGSQVEGLRKEGSRVEVITPDTDSRAAMGTDQTDPATRIPAARAGFAQGKQEATRVTFLSRSHAAASAGLRASSIVQEMPQPGQPPTWWEPVHLASSVPEAALPSVGNTEPAGLRTPSDPAEPLLPDRPSADEVGCEEQHDAVTWPGLVNVSAAIGRFFIRFLGGG